MIHLQPSDRLYISEDLTGYADKITEDGIVSRRVDLLMLGFSFAVVNKLKPVTNAKRHALLPASGLDDETRLAIESVVGWYAKEAEVAEPADAKQLLELICNAGIAGMHALKKRWADKSKSQIQRDILLLSSTQ